MDDAERMKMARERAGFAKEAHAAKEIGCGRTTVIAWENPKNPTPIAKSRFLLDAARAYRVRPEWLRGDPVEDGYPWRPGHQVDAEPPSVIPEEPADLRATIEAACWAQAYIAQALAATIPTAAREVLTALDNKLPPKLRETAYITALRSRIVLQLASTDRGALLDAPQTLPTKPHHKHQ